MVKKGKEGRWGAGKQFNYEPAAQGILGHGPIPLGVIVFVGEWNENELCGSTHVWLKASSRRLEPWQEENGLQGGGWN